MSTPVARALFETDGPSSILSAGGLSDAVIEAPHSRSGFMSLLASILPSDDLKTLTAQELNALIAILAGEVMSNQQIHTILRGRAGEAIRQLRSNQSGE